MRNKIFVGLLGLVLAAASIFPLTRSKAALTFQPQGARAEGQADTLPNYDIRLAGKGEFQDYDLGSVADLQSAAQNSAVSQRAAAFDQFRSNLKSGAGQNLRAVVNETGALKNFFIEGGPLSAPQADTPDNIARGFLSSYASLFALPDSDAANLKLITEDNDEGTTFLTYYQTVGGIKVFEGQVQVVVNRSREVLSVREGFLVDGQQLSLKPSLSEAQGIAKAFEYARPKSDSVVQNTLSSAD